MSVLVARLLTNEEILGKQISITDEYIEFENLVVVHQAPSQNNSEATTIFLAPYAPLSNSKKILIRKSLLVCTYEPMVDLLNKYNSVFGSGIVIPGGIS
ncbi:MAG: hypothetical protein ACK5GV_08685 [Bacteroidota bacterium]|jgi:hypothetical protein